MLFFFLKFYANRNRWCREGHTHTISVVFFVIEDIYIYIIYRTLEVYSEHHLGSPPLGSLVGEFFTDGKAVPPMCNNHMMQSRTV